MPRVRALFNLPVILLLAATAFAYQVPDDGNLIAQAPDILRRVEPPPPKWTAQQLEERADQLRLEKANADAVDYYKAAIKREPKAARYNKLGIAQMSLAHYDEARKALERAIKLDPMMSEAYNNLGVVQYYWKNYRGAIKNYKKAIALDDDSASFHSNLGTAYFARKEYEAASKEYARAIEIDPEIFNRTSRAGVAMRYTGPEDRARYSYVIAKMFAIRGDTDRCILYLKKAMEDGFPVKEQIFKDNEFAGLRKDPRINELLEWKPELIKQ
ncbi:MAG: tetratricopeptide repeat protein [Acidobacteriales bacterium]|nr:tetratricopeptide repeat protein [Terriglobales bacterium]